MIENTLGPRETGMTENTTIQNLSETTTDQKIDGGATMMTMTVAIGINIEIGTAMRKGTTRVRRTAVTGIGIGIGTEIEIETEKRRETAIAGTGIEGDLYDVQGPGGAICIIFYNCNQMVIKSLSRPLRVTLAARCLSHSPIARPYRRRRPRLRPSRVA